MIVSSKYSAGGVNINAIYVCGDSCQNYLVGIIEGLIKKNLNLNGFENCKKNNNFCCT